MPPVPLGEPVPLVAIFEGPQLVRLGPGEGGEEPVGEALRLWNALEEYFFGGVWDFGWVKLAWGRVSAFQREVYERLRRTKPGETITYGQLARELGTSPRAVGRAVAANPWPIVIPCHRVVAKEGLGGFSWGLEVKGFLLALEGASLKL